MRVDVKVVEGLLANPVTEVAKLKVMQEILADRNVEWNPTAGQGSSATVLAHPIEDYQSNSTGISDLGGEAPVANPLCRIQSRHDCRSGIVVSFGDWVDARSCGKNGGRIFAEGRVEGCGE